MRLVSAAWLAASVWWVVGCATPPPDRQQSGPEAPPTVVGRASCEGCHREAAAAWRGSHHDLAMQPATTDTVLGDFADATFTYDDVTSTFFERDGGYWVRTDDADGNLRDFRVAYVFGVEPLQQYLVGFPDGRYQVLALCWDARPADAGGQRWFHIYPDGGVRHDDPLHWTGHYQNWNYMCAECHSTRLAKGYTLADDRYATTWEEIDVSCEACHGPGSRHVAWAASVEAGEAPDAPQKGLVVTLNDHDGGEWTFAAAEPSARRSVPRQGRTEVETCGRCHSRRTQIHGDYRHGAPLADSHRVALLTEGLYHADGQILDEVYVYGSFLQSRMIHEGVSCKDCHDPHSVRLRQDGNALCTTCHMGRAFDTPEHHHHKQDGDGARCVECHMPSRDYMVVDPRRDHGFRVPRPDLSVRIGTPNACNDCHTDRDAAWAAEATAGWYPSGRSVEPHWAEAIHAGRAMHPDAPTALAVVAEDPTVPAIVRATALLELRPWLGPQPDPLLSRMVRDADPLVRIAALALLDNVAVDTRLAVAEPALDDPLRTVRIEAGRVLAPLPPGRIPDVHRAAVQRVVDEYRTAQWFNADRAESHLNLGVLWFERGDAVRAEEAFRRSLAMVPSVPGYLNLADLFRQIGREAEGETLLRKAIALAPEEGAPYHALGLALVRDGRHGDGLDYLRRAVERAPDAPRYAYVYGVGLFDRGEVDAALTVLEQAHDRFPGDIEVLAALATFNREAGRTAAAIGWAEKLVAFDPNPSFRRLLADLRAAARERE